MLAVMQRILSSIRSWRSGAQIADGNSSGMVLRESSRVVLLSASIREIVIAAATPKGYHARIEQRRDDPRSPTVFEPRGKRSITTAETVADVFPLRTGSLPLVNIQGELGWSCGTRSHPSEIDRMRLRQDRDRVRGETPSLLRLRSRYERVLERFPHRADEHQRRFAGFD